jgi:hypothetical protein
MQRVHGLSRKGHVCIPPGHCCCDGPALVWHTCRRDECERVKRCGARVLTLDQLEGLKDPNVEYWGTEEDNDGDPPRLWAPNATYPGTAFTRSIGDSGGCSVWNSRVWDSRHFL